MQSLFQYENIALELDANDPLGSYRQLFALPTDTKRIYFCNNSLGIPPKAAFTHMNTQLKNWQEIGVEGWFQEKADWYRSFDKPLRKPLSHLLGASLDEVVVMNSLTLNLHLLLVSFYRPDASRFKILMEAPSFPSDLYAIKSHLKFHGLNPDSALILLEPRSGEYLLRHEDIERTIIEEGPSIALVFLSGVNFLTGQLLDMPAIAKMAKNQGCVIGFDLAHATGNVPLQLNNWQVDFAVGCSYKYLCSGPGGPGIAYVHSSHHGSDLPRFSGWWGNDPDTRFQMQLQPEFTPFGGAYGWQVSTPSILGMTPLMASLEIYESAGIDNLRKKSERQAAFLLELLSMIPSNHFEIITPRNFEERGAQLSLLIPNNSAQWLKFLEQHGVICDFRPPDIIRITPSPLYNTYHEIYQVVCRLSEAIHLF